MDGNVVFRRGVPTREQCAAIEYPTEEGMMVSAWLALPWPLAAIRPGKDWRDLSTLDGEARPQWARYALTRWSDPTGAVAGSGTNSAWGVADVRVGGSWHGGVLGVVPWSVPLGTITGHGRVYGGAFAVADLRVTGQWQDAALGVVDWPRPFGTITGRDSPTNGAFSLADVRMGADNPNRHASKFHVGDWEVPFRTITGTDTRVGSGAPCIADLRLRAPCHPRAYGILGWYEPAGTITGNVAPGGSACSIADLRITCAPWRNSGVLGVLAWDRPSYTVTASMDLWAGYAAVADERRLTPGPIPVRWVVTDLDKAPPVVPVIPGRGDGSWHRPLTLLERAALQGLPASLDGKPLDLEGTLAKISEHIGNAVPVQAAAAIAGEMLRTMIVAAAGAFMLSSGSGVWVRRRRDGSFPLYLEQELRRASKRTRRKIRVRLAENLPTLQVSSIEGDLR